MADRIGMGADVYQDAAGEWRWKLVAANGRIMADSGEGYTRRRDAYRALATVMGELYQAVLDAAAAD